MFDLTNVGSKLCATWQKLFSTTHIISHNNNLQNSKKAWLKPFIQSYLVVFFGYLAMYLVRKNFIVSQNNLIESYGLTKSTLGYIGFSFSAVYAIGKIVLGYVIYNKNAKNFMMLFLMISAVANIIMGVIFLLPGFYFSLIFGFYLLSGFVQGGGSPSAFGTLINWIPQKNKHLLFALWGTSYRIGGALAAIVAIFGSNYIFNGHIAGMFIVPGVIALLIAIVGFMMGSYGPQAYGLGTVDEIFNQPIAKKDLELSLDDGEPKWKIFYKYVIKNPAVWLIIVSYVLIYIIIGGVMQWSIIYNREVHNFSIEQSAYIYSWLHFGGIFLPLFAILSDKIKGRVSVIVSVSLICSIGSLYFYQIATTYSMVVTATILLSFTLTLPLGMGGWFLFKFIPRKTLSMTDGFIGLWSYLGGDFIAKALLGSVADNKSFLGFSGWSGVFNIIYICMVLLCMLYILMAIIEEKSIRSHRNVKL